MDFSHGCKGVRLVAVRCCLIWITQNRKGFGDFPIFQLEKWKKPGACGSFFVPGVFTSRILWIVYFLERRGGVDWFEIQMQVKWKE